MGVIMVKTKFVLAAVALSAVTMANAAFWSNTSLDLLVGDNYEYGEGTKSATVLTFEHADGWEFGDNYFFFDVTNWEDDDISIYGEFNPRLSLYKIYNAYSDAEEGINTGFVSDVLLSGQIDMGNNFRAYMGGLGVTFDIPGVQYFSVNFMYRDNPEVKGSTFQITPVWSAPFEVANVKFVFRGFLDWIGEEGDNPTQVLTQPQLLLDLGNFWNAPDRLFIGAEYQYWHNKFVFGRDDVFQDENCLQGMVRWVF
jgi:nucleoside-specific outer membrane channel protein Tsx